MVRILFAGDFCPVNRIEKVITDKAFSSLFNDFQAVLADCDIRVLNLEAPLVDRPGPISKVGPVLSARTDSVDALSFANINIVTLANNHILDHGLQGLRSTIAACESKGIRHIGAGENLDDASKPLFIELAGLKFGLINIAENEFASAGKDSPGANPLDPVVNFTSIRNTRKDCDFLIVLVHGGHEGYQLPSPRMQNTYRFFIDSGADLVIGTHPHCFSGYEKYRNGYVFYSLGNFIFDWPGATEPGWNTGYAVKVSFNSGSMSFELLPFVQCDCRPGIRLLGAEEKAWFDSEIDRLNNIISDKDFLYQAWQEFSDTVKTNYQIQFEPLYSFWLKSLRRFGLLPFMLSKSRKKRILNLVRCESHRDLVIESLK